MMLAVAILLLGCLCLSASTNNDLENRVFEEQLRKLYESVDELEEKANQPNKAPPGALVDKNPVSNAEQGEIFVDEEGRMLDASDFYRNNYMTEEKRWYNSYDSYGSRALSGRVMNSVTEAQHKTIIDLHNKLRKQEGSSNMEKLRYNYKLAQLAQTWSQRCVFEHGQPPHSTQDIGYEHIGQNIFAHTDPKFKVEDAVQAWYDEKPDYFYDSMTCRSGKICGHYTQVTWAKTTQIGCGMTYCPSISGLTNAHYIVCNYGPAGNYEGQKPFLKGSVCTQCDSGKFFCNDGLCDETCNSEGSQCQCKASCKKCGTRTGDCTCRCKPGTMGVDCSMQCQDLDPKCGQNPGYPSMLCTYPDKNWDFVKEKCPKMCKKCDSSRGRSTCRKRDASEIEMLKKLMNGYLENELADENY